MARGGTLLALVVSEPDQSHSTPPGAHIGVTDTSQANLTLRSVMTGEDQTGRPTVSFWFHFDWRLAALT